MEYIIIAFIVFVALAMFASANQTPEERDNILFGFKNSSMLCTHCQTKGKVRTKSVTNKKGISGGKATAALLTGGVSLLATGLSRKEHGTQARCDECKNTWTF
jgi:hypothetical protein